MNLLWYVVISLRNVEKPLSLLVTDWHLAGHNGKIEYVSYVAVYCVSYFICIVVINLFYNFTMFTSTLSYMLTTLLRLILVCAIKLGKPFNDRQKY